MSKRIEQLQAVLRGDAGWSPVLEAILLAFECPTGTVHTLDPATHLLILQAQKGIPEFLLDKVDRIPLGKGIAGAAAWKREPVQLCNLQTDNSGVARPDAKLTKVEGALAVPVFKNESVVGVLGIGKMEAYDFTDEEIKDLELAAALIAPRIIF